MKNIFLIFLITVNIQFSQNQFDYTDLFNAKNNPEVSCYRIPSIITAINGDLIAAIDERVPSCGDLKWSRDINIVIRKSSDNGKTWGKIEKIIDYPLGQSASDPSMILDKQTNTIFLFYNYMDLDNQKDIYYLKYISSNDNGKSWSKPVDITNQISKENWKNDFKFITSGRGIQTKKGTLLHCLVNLQKGTHVFGSNDNGKTWFITETPTSPGDESKIVELNDGSWMVNSRVNKLGYRYSHFSNDDGKTWISKKEESIIDPGCNGSLIRYSHGEKNLLLLTNINNKKERKEIVLRYSIDEGKSWSNPKIIYNGETAYSSMTVMENGNLGLFFEMDNYTKNVFTSISIKDVLTYE
mgnify:FL=1